MDKLPKDLNEEPATNASPPRPHWWSEGYEQSWASVKDQVLDGWYKAVEGGKKIEHRVAEQALAFGHGAREAYQSVDEWSADLERRLRRDWKVLEHRADLNWGRVKHAVRHGWERARLARRPQDTLH